MSSLRIVVIEGPDEGACSLLELGARLVVGRGAEAGLVLRDAGVSRLHCALENRVGGLYVEDLGSRAGTEVGGELLRAQGRTLDAPSEVGLGTTRLRAVREEALPALPTVPGLLLTRRLGGGGSGLVFEGRLAGSGEGVAVKLLVEDADETVRRRFEREATLRGRLDHPAIARIFDLRRLPDGRPYLVRELVAGDSLEACVDRSGPWPWRRAIAIGLRVAEALRHAHEQGVLHRDVKPANIIVGPGGQPKLIDFDLAKRISVDARDPTTLTQLTKTGQGLGTLCYVAPEQLTDAREAGPPADVYGLGMTLYHVIGGRRPFLDETPERFLQALFQDGPSSLAARVSELPAVVLRALEKAYARQPGQRYPDIGALITAWSRCLK